jgi:rubrerythrin
LARPYFVPVNAGSAVQEECTVSDDVLVIMQQAIAKEDDRHTFYADAAAHVRNPLARRTFEFLAGDELKHKWYIQAYYEKRRATNQWPAPEECGETCQLEVEELKAVYDAARADLSGAVLPDASLTSVYEIAMQSERDSIDFYEAQLAAAGTAEAQAFYKVLVKAEHLHLELLSKTLEYLDDTEMWYLQEEQWIVEG